MAEFSYWWTTSGTPAGDQVASYTQAHLARISKVLAACGGFEGVAPGYLNQLAGTVTGANTVAINTGGAVVDGKAYDSDASVNVTVPSASGGGNTRIDRIVLRVTWAEFTARLTRIAGTDAASPSAPAITQTSGTTYDIPLYQALVNTSGTVTLTDERVPASSLKYRQGGSATAWASAGTTTHSPTSALQQIGSATLTVLTGTTFVDKTVTFPVAFSGTPIVLLGLGESDFGNAEGQPVALASTVVAGSFSLLVRTADGAVTDADKEQIVNWMAIGPK